MRWVGPFVFFTVWIVVGLAGALDWGGCVTRSHGRAREFWERHGMRYGTSVTALRAAMGTVAVVGVVLLGFGIAAATGLYVAPNK